MLTGGDKMRLVLVEWEDIVGAVHEAIPKYEDDLKKYELIKHTTGYLVEFARHYLVVTDYDVTHDGQGYCHNDFTIIPKGAVRSVHDLYTADKMEDRPLYDPDRPTDDTVARD